VSVLIENAFVVTLDDRGVMGDFAVVVEAGRIAELGPIDALRARHAGAERVNADGRLLMPGLVNAHLHAELHALKGVVEELDLHGWVRADRLNRGLHALGLEECRWIQRVAIRAALAEAVLAGTTTVATYGVTLGADDVAAEEITRIGMRGHVAIRDVRFAPARGATGEPVIPASRLDPPRMYRLHAEEALDRAELDAAVAAHRRGERLIMHAAETRQRVHLARLRFGASTIRMLARADLLSDRVLLSHAVHVDDEEAGLIADAGAVVISSPAAEMKLADGIAPITRYLERGITVALGTDAAICNNSTDMFLECRQLGLVQKLAVGPAAIPAERILRCATAGGAQALGMAGTVGAIEPGRAADLILIDTDNPRVQPLVHRADFSNVAANLVFAATGQDVTDVMVGGEWVVRNRRIRTVDQAEIAAQLARAASMLYDRIG